MRAVRRSALGGLGIGMVLAVAIGVAGCSQSTPTASTAAPSPVGQAISGGAPSLAGAGTPATDASPSQNVESLDKPPEQTGRQIVSTATLTVQVDDVVAAKQKAEALVAGLEPSNVLFAEQTSLPAGPSPSTSKPSSATSTITFKVAPATFAATLDDLAGLGHLSAQEVKTDDVTQQVVDIDARVKAAEESADRVTALVAKTTSLTELAQLENEVEKRQADLESLRGQQRTLAARTELATVVVTLTASVPPPVTSETSTSLPSFLDGLHNGWEAFVNVMTVVGAVAGALLPFAWIPVGLFVGWRLVRRRRVVPPAPAAP